MIRQSAALLHRALRVDTRLIRSHFFRISLLGFLVFLLHEARSSLSTGAPGLQLFGVIHLCNFWFITLAGVTFFATAITEEKEEATLDLLKMAGMSPLAVLAGKWAPRVVGGILLLSVQLPFTILAITLGGVLWDQVIAAFCSLLAHLVLVGCIGLFASVVSARSTGACIVTTLLLLALFLLPPLLTTVAGGLQTAGLLPLSALQAVESASVEFSRASALTRLGEIQVTNFNEPPAGFQVVSNLVTGAGFFLLAWMLFDLCTRNESARANAASWWSTLFRRRRHRSRRAWDAALSWKDFFHGAGGLRVVVFKLVAYALLLLAWLMFHLLIAGRRSVASWRLLHDLGEAAMGTMLFLLFVEVAVIAARCYRIEIRQRTWASLCMLPRSVSEIAYRKLAGHGLALIPVAACFWLGALLAPDTVIDFLDLVFDDADVFLAFIYAVSQLVWLMHLITLLSVTIDWAAWPVAIFCAGFSVFLWNVMFLACLEGAFSGFGPAGEVTLFMICIFGCGQVALTHWLIGERLRILAGR